MIIRERNSGLRAKALPERFVDMKLLPREAFDPTAAFEELQLDPRSGNNSLPPLIKGYLRAGAFDLVDARIAYDLPQGIELAVGARNLLDQNYQLAQGYPEPGRSFFMSARYKY